MGFISSLFGKKKKKEDKKQRVPYGSGYVHSSTGASIGSSDESRNSLYDANTQYPSWYNDSSSSQPSTDNSSFEGFGGGSSGGGGASGDWGSSSNDSGSSYDSGSSSYDSGSSSSDSSSCDSSSSSSSSFD
jgi:hypothetical protein